MTPAARCPYRATARHGSIGRPPTPGFRIDTSDTQIVAAAMLAQ